MRLLLDNPLGDAAIKLPQDTSEIYEGESRERQDEALCEQGDDASLVVIVRRLRGGGVVVAGIWVSRIVSVKPLVQLRARGEHRQGQNQGGRERRDQPSQRRNPQSPSTHHPPGRIPNRRRRVNGV